MHDPEPIILVGSSVRAAAQSAVRAGFSPWCIDQFGDRDLREATDNVQTVANWPNEIESIIQSAPQAKWIYTGALENHPALVEILSRQRPLCGCDHETLSIVRDPAWLADTLAKASLPCLPVIVPASDISKLGDSVLPGAKSDDIRHKVGEWLMKPLVSAAGIGVQNFPSNHARASDFDGHYLQRQARGRVISGLYLAVENSALLIGMCEQLCRGIDAGEFCYVYSGSLGPLSATDVPIDVFPQAQKIGSAIEAGVRAETAPLANVFEPASRSQEVVSETILKGLFGIDFVLDDETGQLWTLEVNPRYTASAELYERAFGWPLMRWHLDACHGVSGEARVLLNSSSFNGEWTKQGKLIVYAERDFIAADIVPLVEGLSLSRSTESRVEVSDIPQLGTLLRKDEPVCTLLTSQENLSTCHEVLHAASHGLLAAIDAIAN
jgi:uncharacterized protein